VTAAEGGDIGVSIRDTSKMYKRQGVDSGRLEEAGEIKCILQWINQKADVAGVLWWWWRSSGG
jgi:hypothetical protein